MVKELIILAVIIICNITSLICIAISTKRLALIRKSKSEIESILKDLESE